MIETLKREISELGYMTLQKTCVMKPHKYDKEYFDFWCKKKASYTYLDKDKIYVLFLDGKNVTKNHKLYNLLDEKGFTYILHQSAKTVMENYEIESLVYTGIDEVSVIFKDTRYLSSVFGEAGCINTIMQIIEQKILKLLVKQNINTEIRGSMFGIEKGEEEKYIDYRKKVVYDLGLTYYAKEFMKPDKYHELSENGIIENLKNVGLYEDFIKRKYLYEGYFSDLSFMHDIDYNSLF